MARKKQSYLANQQGIAPSADEMFEDRSNSHKVKLLVLYTYLQQCTDETHQKTTKELLRFLEEQGISCDRRTLAKDISVLNQYGFSVEQVKHSRTNSYYISDSQRNFDNAELLMLMNAVQASRFINPDKSRDLVKRLSDLAGKGMGEELRNAVINSDTIKYKNKSIFTIIDTLDGAIRANHMVEFKYFDLDENRQRVYRQDGALYNVSPVALVYRRDTYYLMSRGANNTAYYYRIERMSDVRDTEISVSQEFLEWKKTQDIDSQVHQSMNMYRGDLVNELVLTYPQGDYRTLGVIYDQFGEKATCCAGNANYADKGLVKITDIQVGPMLWSWISQSCGSIGLIDPELRKQYREFLMTNIDAI